MGTLDHAHLIVIHIDRRCESTQVMTEINVVDRIAGALPYADAV